MIEVSEYRRRRRSSARKVREMKTATSFLRQQSMTYTVYGEEGKSRGKVDIQFCILTCTCTCQYVHVCNSTRGEGSLTTTQYTRLLTNSIRSTYNVASFPGLHRIAVRITLRVIRTASDDSCGGGLGTRLPITSVHSSLTDYEVLR